MRRFLRRVFWAWVLIWFVKRVSHALTPIVGAEWDTTSAVLLLAVLVVAGLVAYQTLRSARPWLWWPLLGAGVAVWRMARSWSVSCDELGLTIPGNSRFAVVGGDRSGVILKGKPLKVISPRRRRLWFSGCSLILTVRLHPGQTPGQYEKAAEAFSHAWRVHRVRAVSLRPGFVTLTGLGFDPLRYPPRRPTGAGEVLEGGGEPVESLAGNRFEGRSTLTQFALDRSVLVVPVGVREDGQPWLVNAGGHHLVTGATQSGKSTLTVRLISQLSRRPVCLVGIDAKNGMELSPFGPRLSALAMSRAEAVAAIEALIGELTLRSASCRDFEVRAIWDLPLEERPAPIVIVVDEIAELFLAADKDGKGEVARCVTGLVRLAQLGSALGMYLWVAGQRFGSDLGPGATLLRAQLAGRVCHRVADVETAGMTLAGLPPEAIKEALGIPMDLAGVAVAGDDSGAWFMARSYRLSVADAAITAREFAGLKVPLPHVVAAIEVVRRKQGGSE